MTEKQYDFRKRLLEVHQKNRRVQKTLLENQVEVTEDWCIVMPTADPLLALCATDLQDYFKTSMDLTLPLTKIPSNTRTISYEIDTTLDRNGTYRIETCESAVRLIGKDARAAAQAGYLLEDLMNLEEAPYLTIGVEERVPMFRRRMVHSGYGEDVFPDEHLNAIAHSGINTILLFVSDINRSHGKAVDFNDLICRAARYGIDVYAYSCMISRLHPLDTGATEFYDHLYGELFRQCPGLKGIVFVGESVEFPSRDERTSGMSHLENRGPDGKKLIDKPNPGWFPCRDYPQWLDLIKNTIRRESPDADIVFWTYNWGKCGEKERIELIDALPTDISLQATFEMFEDEERHGVPTRSTDYTISIPGPGRYFVSEAIAAKRRGIPLYSMTNACGLTWDVGVIPYEPVPYQWLKRYEQMRRCHEEYGLCGSMESHHYGFYPSFISELAKAFFTTEHADGNAILDRLLVRDWGKENLPAVKKTFGLFSDAINDFITSSADQYGPLRVGPAYPLVLFRDRNVVIPSSPSARHGGNEICWPAYRTKYSMWEEGRVEQFLGEIRIYKQNAERFLEGAAILRTLLPSLPPHKRDEAARTVGIGEFMGHTALTVHHAKRWYLAKERLSLPDADVNAILDELCAVGRDELENVRATLPLVDRDSRLGFEPSMEYMGDREHLLWKAALLEKILDEEIPAMRKN